MLWLGSHPHRVCICPCVHHSFLRTSVACPLFSLRLSVSLTSHFLFTHLLEKDGASFLSSGCYIWPVPAAAVGVGSLACFSCYPRAPQGSQTELHTGALPAPLFSQTKDCGLLIHPWTVTLLQPVTVTVSLVYVRGVLCQTAALKPSLSEGKMYREEWEGRGAFLLTLLFSLLWLDSVAGFFAQGPHFGLLFIYRAPVS